MPKSWNHPNFVNISSTIVDTSMDRSSRVLHHGNIRIWFFLQTNWKLNFDLYFVWLVFILSSKLNFDLYFDLCQRAEIIQVGLNMHLYVDIGDASSSLRGSTSSCWIWFSPDLLKFRVEFFSWGSWIFILECMWCAQKLSVIKLTSLDWHAIFCSIQPRILF